MYCIYEYIQYIPLYTVVPVLRSTSTLHSHRTYGSYLQYIMVMFKTYRNHSVLVRYLSGNTLVLWVRDPRRERTPKYRKDCQNPKPTTMMTTANKLPTAQLIPSNIPASKNSSKRRCSKGGKRKEGGENAPIFLRSEFQFFSLPATLSFYERFHTVLFFGRLLRLLHGRESGPLPRWKV